MSHVGTNPGSKEILQSNKALEAPEKREMGTVWWGRPRELGVCSDCQKKGRFCVLSFVCRGNEEGSEDWQGVTWGRPGKLSNLLCF